MKTEYVKIREGANRMKTIKFSYALICSFWRRKLRDAFGDDVNGIWTIKINRENLRKIRKTFHAGFNNYAFYLELLGRVMIFNRDKCFVSSEVEKCKRKFKSKIANGVYKESAILTILKEIF